MSMKRAILRNRIRKEYGNKGLQQVWHSYQIRKYGQKKYNYIRLLCLPIKKALFMIKQARLNHTKVEF